MHRIQAHAFRETHFENQRLNGVGLEVLTVSQLRKRINPNVLTIPERIDFFMLLLITQGNGKHVIDFLNLELIPDTLMVVRPMQVQQWLKNQTFDGTILLFKAETVVPQNVFSDNRKTQDLLQIGRWPTLAQLSPALSYQVQQAMSDLQVEIKTFEQQTLNSALLRLSLACLLLRLARWFQTEQTLALDHKIRPIYYSFIDELERKYPQRLRLEDYVRTLGYSASTLSRACLKTTGYSAKIIIDRRTALEAQRLLIYSNAKILDIAYQLGFSESTNFIKFFFRIVGESPKDFRKKMLG